MSVPYDTYDYPSYWEGREYEHKAEIIAIKAFLDRVRNVHTALEIGSGYGRLTPSYLYRASRVILTDPSIKLLTIAKYTLKSKKIKFIRVKAENLSKKIRPHSVDLIIVVRVLHHIENIDNLFSVVKKLCKKNGYFILEFPNKQHLKATIKQFIRGNFTYLLDIDPKDISTPKRKKPALPFKNYHPDIMIDTLKKYGFTTIEVRSVSNVRSPFLKRFIPIDILLFIEKYLQIPLSKLFFGPSIFVLSKYNN